MKFEEDEVRCLMTRMKSGREEREKKDRRVWKPVTYKCRVCDRVQIPWEGKCKECLGKQCWDWLDELPRRTVVLW